MKKLKISTLIVLLLLSSSCATLSRNIDTVERDEFLNKFSMVNHQILGELKDDDPSLDLRTLGLADYNALFGKIDATKDHKRVSWFIENNVSKVKLDIRKDTFIVCVRSESHEFSACDDAYTPGTDKQHVIKPLKPIDVLYGELVGGMK